MPTPPTRARSCWPRRTPPTCCTRPASCRRSTRPSANASWRRPPRRTSALTPAESPAAFAEQERMFEHLRAALTDLHFLYGDKAGALMHALRHLIGRAGPTAMEVKLLHGLARQIEWQVRHSADPPG